MCPAVAYETPISHSPPVFSHSPPSSFLTPFNSISSVHKPFPLYRNMGGFCDLAPPTALKHVVVPKRPCLIIRPNVLLPIASSIPATQQTVLQSESSSKIKKRVVFADDKGMSLTHIRIMTEPSNVPPLWTYQYLFPAPNPAPISNARTAQNRCSRWTSKFTQPALDYIAFRRRIDAAKVCLENATVNEDNVLVGTVKVRNLGYQKEVIIRSTWNEWQTFEDTFCTYLAHQITSIVPVAYAVYDTFIFKIPIALTAKKVEFCVKFSCNNCEFWDNNYERNYVITQDDHSIDGVQMKANLINQNAHLSGKLNEKCCEIDTSWSQMENDYLPYW